MAKNQPIKEKPEPIVTELDPVTVSIGIQRVNSEGLSQWQCFVLRTQNEKVIEKEVYPADCKQSCVDYMINELLEKFVML